MIYSGAATIDMSQNILGPSAAEVIHHLDCRAALHQCVHQV